MKHLKDWTITLLAAFGLWVAGVLAIGITLGCIWKVITWFA